MRFTWIIVLLISINASSQDAYAGSTPCDPAIKSMLNIPASVKVEFIKWQMRINKNSPDTFYISINYGESKPNTNGFMNGGMHMIIRGKYSKAAKVYTLQGEKNTLTLVEIDKNVFHFADKNKKLLVGNGGWGYVLNKIAHL